MCFMFCLCCIFECWLCWCRAFLVFVGLVVDVHCCHGHCVFYCWLCCCTASGLLLGWLLIHFRDDIVEPARVLQCCKSYPLTPTPASTPIHPSHLHPLSSTFAHCFKSSRPPHTYTPHLPTPPLHRPASHPASLSTGEAEKRE